MTNKTITLACPFCGSKELKQVTDDGVHFTQCKSCEATGPTGFKRGEDDAVDWNTRAALADPVLPAGVEPEVFEPHGWAQTDGPRINAFTREFDIAEEWAMAGYGTVELLNSEHVEAEIDRLRGEHQAHVGRLQSDVELLAAARHKLCIENENLQAELTKARELLADVAKTPWMYDVLGSVREYVANQSAPADKERFANGTFVGSATLVGSAGNPIWGWKFVESGTPGTPGRWEECPIKFAPADKGQGETVAKHEKHCTLLDPEEPSAECTCNHRFMSLADDPRRCADCDAIEVISEQPAPVAVVMPFDFEHPLSKERRTVTLTKRDVFDGMEDYFYDKLSEQICQCESVGETNVVDCNCDEYVHDFEIVQACLDEFARLNSEPKP